jgi:cell wall-associated NlpC family hydrolase
MAYASDSGRYRWSQLGIGVLLIALAGCSANPRRTVEEPLTEQSMTVADPVEYVRGHETVPQTATIPSRAERAAAAAIHQVGAPYQYGGTGPAGFDCSGLVYYSFRKAGVEVPRTSADLFHATRPVSLDDARPGDLVFFRLEDKVSHVGIYLGNRRFVHAPSHGGSVEVESLENRYFERHLVRAGRLDL